MPGIPDYLRSPTCWSLLFASLAATAVLTPLVMRLARRLGAVDSGGHRRVYQGSMPLLGGLGILVPFVGLCMMGLLGLTGMFVHLESMRLHFAVLGIGSIAIAGLGIVDDTRGLRARYKLLVQTGIALFVVLTGDVLEIIRLPLVGELQIDPAVGVALGVLWIVGLINAMNLIDGVDGLAAGVALIATLGLLALGAIGQYTFVVLVCCGLAGSLIGFLPYNFSPARIFLGDTGSMLLGFVLASITLMGTYKSETAVIVIAPLLVLGLPIFETLLSMARRLIRGAPILGADDGHTHHRLLSRGYSQLKVVLLLYGVSGILTASAIMARLIPKGSLWEWFLLGVVALTLIGTGWLAGYMRTVPVEFAVRRRQRNAVFHAFARYAALSLSAERSAELVGEVLRLGRIEFGLRYLAVSGAGGAARITAGGSAAGGGARERIRVPSPRSGELEVEFEFEEPADEDMRRDVAACLAQLFEQANLDLTPQPPRPKEPLVAAVESRSRAS